MPPRKSNGRRNGKGNRSENLQALPTLTYPLNEQISYVEFRAFFQVSVQAMNTQVNQQFVA